MKFYLNILFLLISINLVCGVKLSNFTKLWDCSIDKQNKSIYFPSYLMFSENDRQVSFIKIFTFARFQYFFLIRSINDFDNWVLVNNTILNYVMVNFFK